MNYRRQRWVKIIAVAVIIGLSIPLLVNAMYDDPVTTVVDEQIEVEEVIEAESVSILVVPTELKSIADCESGTRNADGSAVKDSARHYDESGVVIVGQHTDPKYGQDVGLYQINTLYHEATAKDMGLDIWDEWDNTAYAVHLYNQSGNQPWSSSRSCWSQRQ